jgi:hypothetical protein
LRSSTERLINYEVNINDLLVYYVIPYFADDYRAVHVGDMFTAYLHDVVLATGEGNDKSEEVKPLQFQVTQIDPSLQVPS